jgi:hypothetical protein
MDGKYALQLGPFRIPDSCSVLSDAPRPKKPLILYEYDASPSRKRVWEMMNLPIWLVSTIHFQVPDERASLGHWTHCVWPSYTTHLPVRRWSYQGTFLMHRTLFLEFACFCQVFLAHLLDRHMTVLWCGSTVNNVSGIDTDVEAVRPELFIKIWKETRGHTNTKENTWVYFFERLINYWAYNSGYRMILIGDTSKEFAKEVERNHGRRRVLEPVAESN